jgi:predicted Zn-dependent peptidase
VHEEHRLTELESGVRIVTEHMDSVRSVALGFWIGTGSSAEDGPEAGLSHLIEHMLFRGTSRYESLQIDQLFDAMGAELNAGTGKETTSVYARVLDVHLAEAFDVMADMVWRPRFDEGELEQEREIVLEEIAMYEDDPQDKVFDVLGEAVFGDHPLGRAIIGRAEVVGGAIPGALRAFHAARYVPANVVVAAAGSVDHDALVELVRTSGVERPGMSSPALPSAPADEAPRMRFVAKETEQYHVCLGAPGIARDDDRRFALRVLDNILGGTSSSRLFQEVREKRGLAYNVYSFQSMYAGTGQVGLYLGTRPDNVVRAMAVVADELERMRQDPASEDELARSKENVKGRIVLSLESTTARMNRLGASVLADMPLMSVDEVIERIDAVTLDDIAVLARDLFAPERLSAAGIGADPAAFRRAVEPVSPALVGEAVA